MSLNLSFLKSFNLIMRTISLSAVFAKLPTLISVELFNDEINQVLAKIGLENKLCFIFGDYNINILSFDTYNPTGEFINVMSSNGFYPLISKPTRTTSHTATLIDNIFTNDLDHDKFSGILWSDISDHLPIFQITNCSLKTKTKPSVYHKCFITT